MIPLVLATAFEVTAGEMDFENHHVTLSEHVLVKTSKLATLCASHADFNTETKWVVLYGTEADPVVYKEPKLSFSCERAEAELVEPIEMINAQGNIRISYAEGVAVSAQDGNYSQKEGGLFTLNGCFVTHERGDTIEAASITLNPKNQTVEAFGSPIVFKDHLGQIEAEHALITYNEGRPLVISVDGDVKIQNFATTDHIASDTCLHYVLTDRAELDFTTETLKLVANPEHRTLVYDKVNNIQVSAAAVTVRRNPKTLKEVIKGEGDVRFSFSENELNLFTQRFKMMQHVK